MTPVATPRCCPVRSKQKGLLAGLLLVLGLSSAAIAADVRALGSILYPSYLAMNLAVVCAKDDQAFLSATGGPRGSALAYAEHVKDEVVGGLGANEAERVVREAADAARSAALQMLRSVAGGAASIEARRIRSWCEATAKPLIREVISTHETRHDLFEQMLRAAKRS